jgi:ribosomal protein S7
MNNTLYSNIQGFLIKKGKKCKTKKILDNTIIVLKKKLTKIPSHLILLKVITKLNLYVESKNIRIKRKLHVVPFSVAFKRRVYLSYKCIKEAVYQDKRKVSFSEKLNKEIFNLLLEKASKSYAIKKKNLLESSKNISNLHYRW